jgi:hypothetical protein
VGFSHLIGGCSHVSSDHGTHRKKRRKPVGNHRVTVPGDDPVHHTIGGSTVNPPVEIHQQKCEIVAYVNCRQLLVKLQCVERHRPSTPHTEVAKMKIAMTPPDRACLGTSGKPGRPC